MSCDRANRVKFNRQIPKCIYIYIYADDVCLVSHKYERMQRKLDDLWKESKKAGLEINYSKTEEMRVNTIVNQGLRLNGEDIK